MKKTLITATLAVSAPAWAQQAPVTTVVVTGNPLAASQIATPHSVLSGDALVLRRAGSLGETLDGLPGVSATYFGPNANRPVIRGQDGDRIRVLSNAGATLDASSLSFDHAVPIEPLLVERIEVLRGPAALLYGGSAVGGVVNAIDNRIPVAPVDAPTGAVEARLGGAAGERSLAARLEGGGAGLAWHADAFGRRTDDLRVPAFDRPLEDGGTQRSTRILNSASDASGGALGASMVGADGYLGASLDTYRNDYGIVVEEDIEIRMRRDRLTLAGELRLGNGPLTTLRGRASGTDYRHEEIEGTGEVGTRFENRGGDLRLEALHRALPLGGGRIDGSFGLQAESSRFSALGEEAFLPSTRTRQTAAFLLERWTWDGRGELSAGVRAEQVRVTSDGDAAGDELRFGPPQRRDFSPRSASVGAVLDLAPGWQLTSSLAYTERAPTSYELFADGVHVATATYERGDPLQGLERGRNIDVSLGWRAPAGQIRLGVFESRFANYIVLAATGEPDHEDDEGNLFPVYAYDGVRARLRGVELEGTWRLADLAPTVDLDMKLDLVRGTDLDHDQPLPRLAPRRATVGLTLAQGPWTVRAEAQHAAAQKRVPDDDRPTPGWTQFHVSASYATRWADMDALLYLKLHNLGDELAYNATSIATVRPLVPLPGRALSAGLRLSF